MDPNLQHVLKRLRVMVSDYAYQKQERNFDLFGINVCTVEYDHQTMLFSIFERQNNGTFIFDDIDLAAIEIYNQLVDFQLVF
ncbi:DUF1797 family protein [Periweissella ghanensis]|uniref:DUF1797 family protein n=1 Tax=Periweissella ghanensis TaxID=467997 RepID=A0ABM8ZBJ3_9LACO|nr:DUF1797 family protein [Periweissella ghanensis]MCM0601588.1 DUF1797 family protein [Periweissella ghanensis]CAH0418665.1 hypothetical protein WGH24286_01096 [Periweissella ghanensis]